MTALDLDAIKADLAEVASVWAVLHNQTAMGEQSEILALVETGSALVAEVERLRALVVEPTISFNEWLPNDGELEFTATSDCDGSRVRYFKRTPAAQRADIDYGPWLPATEQEHARAVAITYSESSDSSSTGGEL